MPQEVIDSFRAIQRNAALTYGVWLGGRVSTSGLSLKLYLELPEGQRASLPKPPFTLPDRSLVMRMIAYSSDGMESYARVPSMEPRHLPAVLAAAGLQHRAGEVLDRVRAMYGCTIRGRLPGPSVGVSLIGAPASRRVTLYFFARALWGTDARTRRELLRIAAASGWNADAYERATATLASRESAQTYHGLVGLTCDRETTSIAVGVRPVGV